MRRGERRRRTGMAGGTAALCAVLALLFSHAAQARPRPRPSAKKPLALVVNYPYQIAGDGKTFIHVVLHTPDMKPARGAVVRVDGKEVCRADEHGTCIFRFAPGAGRHHTLVATYQAGGRSYEVRHAFACNARTQSFRTDHLFVYTDRGVYNPGDTLHVRVIAWQLLGGYTPLPGAKVHVMLQTTAGKVLGGSVVDTDEFGIGALDFPLPATMPPGQYELAVVYRKARHADRIQVRRHVAPVLAIHHDLPRWVSPATKALDVHVEVESLAGASLDDVAVTLSGRVGDAVVVAPQQLTRQGAAAKWQGRLAADAVARLRKAAGAEGTFQLVLVASTPEGLHAEVRRPVVATERPYRAVLEPDKDAYVKGEHARLDVKVADLDGRPTRGLTVRCKPGRSARGVEVRTGDDGIATCTLVVPGGSAGLHVVVTTPAMRVPLGEIVLPRRRPKPLVSKVTQPPAEAGGLVHVRATFGRRWVPREKVLHVDMTDTSGALVVATTVPVRRQGSTWVVEGDVEVPSWGTMLVNLYMLASARTTTKRFAPGVRTVGLVTEGQRVTVTPAAHADITIEGWPQQARPGQRLTLRIRTSTPAHDEAALGVSLTDAGVLSLLDPLEVPPQDVFYDPRGKALATGGAGVLTWPVVDRNWGQPRHDIAYTNWGFKAPGPLSTPSTRKQHAKASGGDSFGAMGVGGAGVEGVGSGKSTAADKPAPAATIALEAQSKKGEASPARARRRARGARGGPASAKPAITIRTKFPDTALWLPRLRTRDGVVQVDVQLPDAISVQRLTVVASDRHGNVGVARKDVAVRQDLSVVLALPAGAALGDRLQAVALVTNRTEETVYADLEATCEGADVAILDGEGALRLPAGTRRTVRMLVAPTRAGTLACRARLVAKGRTDEEVRTLHVSPAGVPVARVARGQASATAPWEVPLEVDASRPHRSWIAVDVSPAVTALSGWEALAANDPPAGARWVRWGVRSVASQALAAAARLRLVEAEANQPRQAEALRRLLRRAAVALSIAQEPSGAWSFRAAPDAANPRGGVERRAYLTAFVLRAVAAIRQAGIEMDDGVVSRAVGWLLEQRGDDGLWAPGKAWFWAPRAARGGDWALTADIATGIVEALATLPEGEPPEALRKLVERVRRKVAKAPDDVALMAHGARLLRAWTQWTHDREAARTLEEAFASLVALRRRGHWEPHWYHAWGGTVELDATLLDLVLQRPNWREHSGIVHELLASLEATRDAWGTWHNEVGTAVAVAALLRAAAVLGTEQPDAVVVLLDGAPIARATRQTGFDALRWVELPSDLTPGEHRVAVRVEGPGRANVRLSSEHWVAQTACDGTCVERTAPHTVRAGVPFDVAVAIDPMNSPASGGIEIVDHLPTGAHPDRTSLDALVEQGTVQAYDVHGATVVLALSAPTSRLVLRYRAVAERVGTFVHPGTVLRDAQGAGVRSLARDAAVTVR